MNLIHFIKRPKAYFAALKQRLLRLWRSVAYKGDHVICGICGWKGQQFFDGKCPKCNSLPRTRLVPFSLDYFNLIHPYLNILHIAPNVHEYHFILKSIGEKARYDRLNIREVSFINVVQDITRTTLANETYDLVLAWHVLEHIPEDKKAIQEVYRLLKPGGHFLVSVPIYPKGNTTTYEDSSIAYEDYEAIHGHDDHCRSCGLDYCQRFEAVGFVVQTLEVKTINLNDIFKFGLLENHVVWCFKK